jgi:hypothetical protein
MKEMTVKKSFEMTLQENRIYSDTPWCIQSTKVAVTYQHSFKGSVQQCIYTLPSVLNWPV